MLPFFNNSLALWWEKFCNSILNLVPMEFLIQFQAIWGEMMRATMAIISLIFDWFDSHWMTEYLKVSKVNSQTFSSSKFLVLRWLAGWYRSQNLLMRNLLKVQSIAFTTTSFRCHLPSVPSMKLPSELYALNEELTLESWLNSCDHGFWWDVGDTYIIF